MFYSNTNTISFAYFPATIQPSYSGSSPRDCRRGRGKKSTRAAGGFFTETRQQFSRRFS